MMLNKPVMMNQVELDYIYSLIEKDIFPCSSNLPKSPNEVAMIKELRAKIASAFAELEKEWQSVEE